jgi:hypothetical protein
MSPFLSDVLRALGSCRTPTDYYRVQIDIQKYATPADIAALTTRPIPWTAEFDAWVDGFFASVSLPRAEVQDFRLERLGESVTLYSGPSPARGLVVAFCGKADLLFMPLAMVLQYFSPERHTVLILRDPARSGFVSGMAGHSSSLREMVGKLQNDLDVGRYDSVHTFGTSGGGAAALAAGLLLGATSAVSFSGHLPTESRRYGSADGSVDIDRILRGAQAMQTNGYACVYGADNKVDSRNAMALASAVPVRLMPVPGVSDHNVVFALHQRRQLAALLSMVGLTT